MAEPTYNPWNYVKEIFADGRERVIVDDRRDTSYLLQFKEGPERTCLHISRYIPPEKEKPEQIFPVVSWARTPEGYEIHEEEAVTYQPLPRFERSPQEFTGRLLLMGRFIVTGQL